MSMSQEEIEALMSGADDMDSQQEEETPQETEESKVEENTEQEPVIEEVQETNISEDDKDDKKEETSNEDDIDDILSGIDGIVDDGTDTQSSEESMDDILSGIDGIVDDTDTKEEDSSDKGSQNIEDLIDANQYPLPVKNENKVVNQLNQVADDSEEKASQIFDVLSFILDENNEIQNYNKNMGEFLTKQIALLESLSAKFPNIDIFKQNLEQATQLLEGSGEISNRIDAENNKVFEAMELMQFHDINRQKIERVMAVIRKLNSYLNGIFEDDSDKAEVQIAKHISGDSNVIVDENDLESLISEFANEG